MTLGTAGKLRLLHVFVHLMLIPAFIYGEWWMWLGAFFMWFLTGGIGISLGFHRYFSHRSFKTYPWFENVMLFLGSMTGGGTPLSWVGTHRFHHKYSDTEDDPHGPVSRTVFQSYTHQWQYKRIPRTIIKDLVRMPNVLWMHKNYWKVMFIWAFILLAIDPLVFVFGFCVPAVAAYHTYAQINTFCHLFGYRNFRIEGQSSNIPFMFWAFGENYHNNHHRFPWSYRIGLRWWEFDPCAWLLERGLMTRGDKPLKCDILVAMENDGNANTAT